MSRNVFKHFPDASFMARKVGLISSIDDLVIFPSTYFFPLSTVSKNRSVRCQLSAAAAASKLPRSYE